jgi:hypothetical protein
MNLDEIKVKQTIGQLEASIDKVEIYLNDDDFKEYCDSIATAITYWKTILKRIKKV